MKFKLLFFLFFATVVLCFSQDFFESSDNSEWYHGKTIRDVVFTGLNNIQQSELDALMNPYKGQLLDDNLYWEMQGKLYALEYFDRIEPSITQYNISGSEVLIRFAVAERPIIGRIIFTGNSGMNRRELNELIVSRVNDIYNKSKVFFDIDSITNKYLEKGYPDVIVTSTESLAADSTITLVFNITESDQITISRIEFQGNVRFSSTALKRQLSLKARAFLVDGAFQESKLVADREAILKYYRDRGYIDARIVDVTQSYESDSKRTNMILTFMIEEGSEFKFGGVTFEGNIIFTTTQLSDLITTKTGDTINWTRLEMDLQRVNDLYFENGYIYNVIAKIPDKNNQTNTLSFNVQITERSRAYVENVIVVGNEKTRTNVILREIALEPGDIFSRTKVLEATRNLYNLQFFANVWPDILQGSAENLMDLIINVEEQPTTDIQFGLTFTGSSDPNSFPISGLLKWNDRNLAGTGNQLGVEVNSSIVDTSSISLDYMHRWVLGLPLSLGIDFTANYSKRMATIDNQPPFFYGKEEFAYPDGFDSYAEYIYYNKTPTNEFLMSYEQWYLSLGISSGYKWYTMLGDVSLNGGLRIGLVNNIYDNIFRPFDPVIREGNNTWAPKNLLWLTLSLDRRDIFYDPSAGYYIYERFGIYGIFNNEIEHYLRSDTKFQYYMTLFDFEVTDNWNFKCVLAVNAGISVIFKQPGRRDSLLSSIESANKLAIDGMFVGRGWKDEYLNKGMLLLDNWIELRFPLVRGILAFDLFFDAVAVETDEGYYFGENSLGESNFTIENFRFGFGGGLRFTIPQFPIRLSLVKRFRFKDGIHWVKGPIFGMDLVMSFVMSY
ncbi:MAG: outer membrane protein assembly factor BamA [Treponema sp.]|nr:outer membrane protein assembly factor BamA [Treponema sp.]